MNQTSSLRDQGKSKPVLNEDIDPHAPGPPSDMMFQLAVSSDHPLHAKSPSPPSPLPLTHYTATRPPTPAASCCSWCEGLIVFISSFQKHVLLPTGVSVWRRKMLLKSSSAAVKEVCVTTSSPTVLTAASRRYQVRSMFTCSLAHLFTCTPAHVHTCSPDHLFTCIPVLL